MSVTLAHADRRTIKNKSDFNKIVKNIVSKTRLSLKTFKNVQCKKSRWERACLYANWGYRKYSLDFCYHSSTNCLLSSVLSSYAFYSLNSFKIIQNYYKVIVHLWSQSEKPLRHTLEKTAVFLYVHMYVIAWHLLPHHRVPASYLANLIHLKAYSAFVIQTS